MTLPTPIVGDWYLDRDGDLFEVVAIDEADRTIEIQHFDGALEEFDSEEWLSLLPQPAEAPEDWSGSMDMDNEDRDEDTHTLLTAPAWLNGSDLDRDEADGFSEVPLH